MLSQRLAYGLFNTGVTGQNISLITIYIVVDVMRVYFGLRRYELA